MLVEDWPTVHSSSFGKGDGQLFRSFQLQLETTLFDGIHLPS